MDQSECSLRGHFEPWNKGKLVGQKSPLRLKEIWAIRIRLQLAERLRELALFNLAVDSKLRSCDLVKLRVRDVTRGNRVAARRKRGVPCNSRSRSRLESRSQRGSAVQGEDRRTSCFLVACGRPVIFQRVSTPVSCADGSERLDSTRQHTAPTRCAAPRRH